MKLSFVAAISIILFVKTTFENPLINVGTSEVNISMIKMVNQLFFPTEEPGLWPMWMDSLS